MTAFDGVGVGRASRAAVDCGDGSGFTGASEVLFNGTPAELVALTRGSVWQAHVDDAAFEELRRAFKVVHHMRDGERIRVRILSPVRPVAAAVEVVPNLEDSYIWLLGQEA